MFEGLKKKFSSFVDSITKKEAAKPQEQDAQSQHEPPQPQQAAGTGSVEAAEEGIPDTKRAAEGTRPEEEAAKISVPESRAEPARPAASVLAHEAHASDRAEPAAAKHPGDAMPHITHAPGETKHAPEAQKYAEAKKVEHKAPEPKAVGEPARPHTRAEDRPAPEKDRKQKEPKATAFTRIKGFVFGSVRISERDAEPFIEELKIGLLQSDVNYDVAEKVTESISRALVGRQVDSRNLSAEIRQVIRGSIMEVLAKGTAADMVEAIKERSRSGSLPFKILFIGPNGAGKTTTMAKIASMLKSNGITCLLSASDTFRAAAIEQTVFHANKLGIEVIKGTYGADPASVAFDAIAHAKARGIMAVLIDSAGRQETNKSLIEELKKMSRVAKPDLKVFVGESISGNALLSQVKALNEAVGVDGIILTKLDCDSKGGNTLSILGDTTVPVMFFGTGEKYGDIMPYDPNFIVDNMLPNN